MIVLGSGKIKKMQSELGALANAGQQNVPFMYTIHNISLEMKIQTQRHQGWLCVPVDLALWLEPKGEEWSDLLLWENGLTERKEWGAGDVRVLAHRGR